MAKILTDPQCSDRKKVTCDVPRCFDARAARGQANGRWLMSVEFDGNRTVTITTMCKECGGTHSVTLEIPKKNETDLTPRR
jgi:hypothetical protein